MEIKPWPELLFWVFLVLLSETYSTTVNKTSHTKKPQLADFYLNPWGLLWGHSEEEINEPVALARASVMIDTTLVLTKTAFSPYALPRH